MKGVVDYGYYGGSGEDDSVREYVDRIEGATGGGG
jgi:hypothetical protein